MIVNRHLSPEHNDEARRLNPLHLEYFIGEAVSFKARHNVGEFDLRTLSWLQRDSEIDIAKTHLFELGVPSAEHMNRITELPIGNPQRKSLDDRIRLKLASAERGLGLVSMRPDYELSASMELGLNSADDDIYAAILFGDRCYRVTLSDSRLSVLKPPQGLFCYLPNSFQLRALRDLLPDFDTLLDLEGISGQELRDRLPRFSLKLREFLSSSNTSPEGRLTLHMDVPNECDKNTPIELRFETCADRLLDAFYLVGPKAWYAARFTLRTWRNS